MEYLAHESFNSVMLILCQLEVTLPLVHHSMYTLCAHSWSMYKQSHKKFSEWKQAHVGMEPPKTNLASVVVCFIVAGPVWNATLCFVDTAFLR